ncbi:MAG: hypothetical protein V4590_13980 [Bacteroidota bacterium]
MAVTYEIKERRVIPNWRDFNRTVRLGELYNIQGNIKTQFDITRPVNDWNDTKTIGTAADLINSAFIAGKSDLKELNEAIDFVFKNKTDSSNSLADLIAKINQSNDRNSKPEKSGIIDLEVDTFEEFQTHIDNQLFYRIINKTKNRALKELNNPIIWVELARLYSFIAQKEKAERAIKTALQLAPDNRFVLRSAVRFFVHFEEPEKALFFLRKSEMVKMDPWLVSAHISTSSLLNRFSPFIKTGFQLIKSKNHSNYSLTELASSLGTLEFFESGYKKAKPLFDLSILNPNDNTLAQLEWVSQEDSRFKFNPLIYSDVPNSFEAFALEQFEQGNWKEAFNNCIKWFLDMPYSKRPVLLGSYIASSLLRDTEAAIMLCEAGIKANPNDINVLNNTVYSMLQGNQYDKVKPYVEHFGRIKIEDLPQENRITFIATLGLIAMRGENLDSGKKLYETAISYAERLGNNYLRDLAMLNYCRELILKKDVDYLKLITHIEKMETSKAQSDIIQLRDDVIKMHNGIGEDE